MSDGLQFGRHPDADQLSAFVEQALPAHEREATLAHLAICAECRAVVALSQPAAAPHSAPAENPARRAWFHGWNLVWPATATLAALALAIVFVYHSNSTRSSPGAPAEMAVARPPAPIAPPRQPQKPSSAPAPNRLQPHRTSPMPQPVRGNPETQNRLQSAPPEASPAARTQPAIGGVVAGSTSIAASGQSTQPLTMPGGRGPEPPSTMGKAQLNSPAPPAAAMDGLGGSAESGQVQPATAAPGPALTLKEASRNLALQALPPVRPLPSGLPVLSMAVHGRQMLAIDDAHAVFLSEDSGAHWKAILVPWKSRAVKVSLISSATGFAARPGSGPGGWIRAGTDLGPIAEESAASLTGTVTDLTGAVIPGASVVLTGAVNHASLTVRTGRDGRYTVTGLKPGTYNLEARASGFKTERIPAVAIAASRQNITNLTLHIGEVSQSVTVTAGAMTNETLPSTPASAPATGAAPSAVVAQSAIAAPAPVFEITTEDGSRWASADGLTWKQQ